MKEEMVEKELTQEDAPKYDPQKKYTWSQNAQFVMSGPEFGLLLNTLRVMVASDEVQKALMLHRSASIIETMLARAVETGLAKEVS